MVKITLRPAHQASRLSSGQRASACSAKSTPICCRSSTVGFSTKHPQPVGAKRPVYRPSSARGNDWLDEPIAAREPLNPDPRLINSDFSPTLQSKRTFDTWDLAALWIGLVVSITTYYLAGSLIDMGMSWWQGIVTVFLGNIITLVPMVLNAHPGTKYGIPFPVLARASFGIHGANLPSLLRALVACGWFGIQTWVGGSAIHQIGSVLTGGALAGSAQLAWLGISASELACFLLFWAMQVVIILRGMEAIRMVEKYAAPLLIALSAALLAWAHAGAGGFGPMLAAPSQFGPGMPLEGRFWAVFVPAVTANVGYWATLSLNIPDFTRYARSQREQVAGQALGLPLFMAAFTFVGLAVTSASCVMFGVAIKDPVLLLARLPGPLPITLGLVGLVLATLSTNIAANIVAPANALVNLAPGRVSFNAAAVVTSLLGLLSQPWRLIASSQGFIYTWLIGYSALLGPIGGVIIADYFLLRRRCLDLDALYSAAPTAAYWYSGGWNRAALAALVLGVLPSLPGFLQAVGLLASIPHIFATLYSFAWFVGTGVAIVAYCTLMPRPAALEPPALMAPALP